MSAEKSSEIPQFIITAAGDVLGQDTPDNREIVRRIHACFNACEGISTADLEQGIIKDMCQAMAQVIPLLKKDQKVA